jgi:hypothetical protein
MSVYMLFLYRSQPDSQMELGPWALRMTELRDKRFQFGLNRGDQLNERDDLFIADNSPNSVVGLHVTPALCHSIDQSATLRGPAVPRKVSTQKPRRFAK